MEKFDELIKKFKDAKEALNKNVNESYAGEPNMTKGETKHDRCAREVAAKNPDVKNPHAVCVAEGIRPEKWGKSHDEHISLAKNGQWELHKAGPEAPHKGSSAFNMDHVREVSGMKDHAAAKAHAHKIVEASTANAGNKAKLKTMINGSKNVAHLAQGMSNHILAHPSENLKVGR